MKCYAPCLCFFRKEKAGTFPGRLKKSGKSIVIQVMFIFPNTVGKKDVWIMKVL
jgi:hypothetical protein